MKKQEQAHSQLERLQKASAAEEIRLHVSLVDDVMGKVGEIEYSKNRRSASRCLWAGWRLDFSWVKETSTRQFAMITAALMLLFTVPTRWMEDYYVGPTHAEETVVLFADAPQDIDAAVHHKTLEEQRTEMVVGMVTGGAGLFAMLAMFLGAMLAYSLRRREGKRLIVVSATLFVCGIWLYLFRAIHHLYG